MSDKTGKLYTLSQLKKKGLKLKNYRKVVSRGVTDFFMHKDSIPSGPKFPMPVPSGGKESKKLYEQMPFRGMKKGGMVKRGGRDMFSQQYD